MAQAAPCLHPQSSCPGKTLPELQPGVFSFQPAITGGRYWGHCLRRQPGAHTAWLFLCRLPCWRPGIKHLVCTEPIPLAGSLIYQPRGWSLQVVLWGCTKCSWKQLGGPWRGPLAPQQSQDLLCFVKMKSQPSKTSFPELLAPCSELFANTGSQPCLRRSPGSPH